MKARRMNNSLNFPVAACRYVEFCSRNLSEPVNHLSACNAPLIDTPPISDRVVIPREEELRAEVSRDDDDDDVASRGETMTKRRGEEHVTLRENATFKLTYPVKSQQCSIVLCRTLYIFVRYYL